MTVKFDMADKCRAEIFYQLFAQLFLKNAKCKIIDLGCGFYHSFCKTHNLYIFFSLVGILCWDYRTVPCYCVQKRDRVTVYHTSQHIPPSKWPTVCSLNLFQIVVYHPLLQHTTLGILWYLLKHGFYKICVSHSLRGFYFHITSDWAGSIM